MKYMLSRLTGPARQWACQTAGSEDFDSERPGVHSRICLQAPSSGKQEVSTYKLPQLTGKEATAHKLPQVAGKEDNASMQESKPMLGSTSDPFRQPLFMPVVVCDSEPKAKTEPAVTFFPIIDAEGIPVSVVDAEGASVPVVAADRAPVSGPVSVPVSLVDSF